MNLAPRLSALARDRLVQFLVGGGLLFALDRSAGSSRAIHLSSAELPAPGPARDLAIQDEVLVREAQRLGLDRDDPVVRRRLVEKALFLAEDLAGASSQPEPAALQAHFAAHPERWRRPAEVSLVHVVGQDPAALEALRPALLAWSAEPGHERVEPPFGEPWPTSRRLTRALPDLAQDLGPEFASEAEKAAPGAWSAPVRSRAGWHLLRVVTRQPGGEPTLEEVRAQVELDLLAERRQAAARKLLEEAFSRWRVDLDGQPLAAPPAAPRSAARADPSAED